MTNRSNRWLLVTAALLGVALLIPIVSAQGGHTSIATTDDTAQGLSSETANYQGPPVDNRSAVADSDRPENGPLYHGHHQSPWVNGTDEGEWANETDGPHDPWVNETYGLHGPMYHGAWVNGTYGGEWTNETDAPYNSWVNSTYNGEWTNETYDSHGHWTDESQDDDVWTNETDGSAIRTGGRHRGPGGC